MPYCFFGVKRGDRRTGLTLSFREESEFSARKVSKLMRRKNKEYICKIAGNCRHINFANFRWLFRVFSQTKLHSYIVAIDPSKLILFLPYFQIRSVF